MKTVFAIVLIALNGVAFSTDHTMGAKIATLEAQVAELQRKPILRADSYVRAEATFFHAGTWSTVQNTWSAQFAKVLKKETVVDGRKLSTVLILYGDSAKKDVIVNVWPTDLVMLDIGENSQK